MRDNRSEVKKQPASATGCLGQTCQFAVELVKAIDSSPADQSGINTVCGWINRCEQPCLPQTQLKIRAYLGNTATGEGLQVSGRLDNFGPAIAATTRSLLHGLCEPSAPKGPIKRFVRRFKH